MYMMNDIAVLWNQGRTVPFGSAAFCHKLLASYLSSHLYSTQLRLAHYITNFYERLHTTYAWDVLVIGTANNVIMDM